MSNIYQNKNKNIFIELRNYMKKIVSIFIIILQYVIIIGIFNSV